MFSDLTFPLGLHSITQRIPSADPTASLVNSPATKMLLLLV